MRAVQNTETISSSPKTASLALSVRSVLSSISRKVLEFVVKFIKKPNIIYDHLGTAPYLSRYYLLRGPKSADGTHPFDHFGRPKDNIVRTEGWSLVLHKFHQSDSTTLIHNHGWTWGLSFVLAGGYFEEKVVPVINFYKERGQLIHINGEQSIEDVFKEIIDKIND